MTLYKIKNKAKVNTILPLYLDQDTTAQKGISLK